jgi:iron(III) transport system permease protein
MTGKGVRPARFQLGGWKYLTMALMLIFVLLSTVLPYLALMYGALVPFITPEVDLSTLGLQNFRDFMETSAMVTGLKNTVTLIVVGALLTTILATVIGYLTRRRGGLVARLLETVALMPLAVPTLSFALGLLWYVLSIPIARDHLYGTVALLYLAQMATFLPLGIQIISSGVLQLGAELEDAARLSGAPSRDRMGKVVLPLLRPTIASAWLVLALYASIEAGTSIFLYTAGSVTTAVNVFTQALHGFQNLMYAGAFVLATFGLVAVAIGNRLFGAGQHLKGSTG